MDAAFALIQQQAQQVAILLQNQHAEEARRQALQEQIMALTHAGIAVAEGQRLHAPARDAMVKPLALPKFSAKMGPSEAAFAPWLNTVLVLTRGVADIDQRTNLLVGALEGPALSKFSVVGEPQLRARAPGTEEEVGRRTSNHVSLCERGYIRVQRAMS